MAQPLRDTLANVSAQAERRLDKLNGYFPTPPKQAVPFEEYLPRALQAAQTDEKFARELARSLYLAARMGG